MFHLQPQCLNDDSNLERRKKTTKNFRYTSQIIDEKHKRLSVKTLLTKRLVVYRKKSRVIERADLKRVALLNNHENLKVGVLYVALPVFLCPSSNHRTIAFWHNEWQAHLMQCFYSAWLRNRYSLLAMPCPKLLRRTQSHLEVV